jgi:hypothetical protein
MCINVCSRVIIGYIQSSYLVLVFTRLVHLNVNFRLFSRTLNPSPTYFLDLQPEINVQIRGIAFVILSSR